jgi:hypothetical protein
MFKNSYQKKREYLLNPTRDVIEIFIGSSDRSQKIFEIYPIHVMISLVLLFKNKRNG